MQDAGWKYKHGPEPYAKVYVPPNGSVRVGSVLGADFFQADHQLWAKAEELGIIDTDSDNDQHKVAENSSEESDEETLNVRSSKKPAYISSPESCSGNRSIETNMCESSNKLLDNRHLCGLSFSLTEKSRMKVSMLVSNFLSKCKNGGNFYRNLWQPLWNCINIEQGSECEELGWKYTKSIGAGNLGRNHWYCPPNSDLGGRGKIGRDYFTTEEAVVAFLLRDLKQANMVTSLSIEEFEIKLSRAMEEHLPFDEINLSSNGKMKRRIRKRNNNDAFSEKRDGTPTKKTRKGGDRSASENADEVKQLPTITNSQNTVKGAALLLELKKIEENNKQIINSAQSAANRNTYSYVATKQGILNLVKFRRKAPNQSDVTPISKESSSKKKRKQCAENVVFHLTQAPGDSTMETWSSPLPTKRMKGRKLPLKGFTFFGSGIGAKVQSTVTKLGGKFLKDVHGESLKRANVVKKLFFLSDFTNRRTLKYLLACSLGVPMLQYEWIFDIERKFDQFQNESSSMKRDNPPSIFDPNLYKAHR